MESNKCDLLDSETDGFITPTDNADRKILDFNKKPGFNRSEILGRRLFESSPLSRGIITLRKVNLAKLFCDEFLLGELLESCMAYKDTVSNISALAPESTLILASGNTIANLQEHEAPEGQNQQRDCELVNMAAVSVSEQMPTFELTSKPSICRDEFGRGLSGTFIQIPKMRKESAGCALQDKQCHSVVSSSSLKLKKGAKLKRQNNKQKAVAERDNNLVLQSSDLSKIIGADTISVSSTRASYCISETLNRRNECIGPSEQSADNIPVFKLPAMHVQSKHVDKQLLHKPDLKVSTKVRHSCGDISMSSFSDSSFSPVQFQLPPESPQKTSVVTTEIVQPASGETHEQTELTLVGNHRKVQGNKRKIKNAKASVAEVRNNEKSSKENCVVEAKGGRNTRSAMKHFGQENHRKECADSTSQPDILDLVKSRKTSRRIKTAGKREESEKKKITENAHEKVSETSAVTRGHKSKQALAENTAIMNMCNEKLQCIETNICENVTLGTRGKMLTRKQRGVIKNPTPKDTLKESKVTSRRSLIPKKLDQQGVAEQSLVLKANSSRVSLPNECLTSKSIQREKKHNNDDLLKSKLASNDVGVTRLRNRNSLTKSTSSKPQQSNRSSLPVWNTEDQRPDSALSRHEGCGEQCVTSESRNQAEIRLHFNPKSSLSGNNYRGRSKNAVSTDAHKQKEAALTATESLKINKLKEMSDTSVHDGKERRSKKENVKINKLKEVCDIGVHDSLQDQGNHQVLENSPGGKMNLRQLRKRKIDVNLTENTNDKTLEISVLTTTHAKVVKPTKQAAKVATGSLPEEHVSTLEKVKKQTAKKGSCPEVTADNEHASKSKKETVRRKQSEAATNAAPIEESSKKEKVTTRKKPAKLKSATQQNSNEDHTRLSDTRQASQKFVGAHCSAAGGVSNAVFEAVSMGARAFALFVRNGRTWKLNPINVAEAEKFKEACKVHGFLPLHILPHGSYLLNCGSSNVETLQKSRDTLVHELQICEMLGLEMYNFHPGSACGKGTVDECLVTIAESINLAHQKTNHVKTVIENMSCQGQTVGGKFEELKTIIDNVKDKSRIGVCLDTCHAFAAGFDLSSHEGFNKCIESFDRIIGLHYLCAMHLNDSKGELGCHLDRHENIGKGHIGLEGFRHVMNDPRLNNIPMILETPVNDYAKEIRILCDLENI